MNERTIQTVDNFCNAGVSCGFSSNITTLQNHWTPQLQAFDWPKIYDFRCVSIIIIGIS